MVTFAPCVYDDYSKKLLIATLITSFFDGEKEVQEQLTNPLWRSQQLANWNLVQRALGLKEDRAGYRDHIQAMFQETMKENKIRFRANLMRLACHFKHSGFKDEQEWRLVLPHLRSKTDITSPIMTRGGGMIPYVAFDLRNLRFGGITRFMLAPCCESTEEEALRQAGYDGIIETSRIPLRCG